MENTGCLFANVNNMSIVVLFRYFHRLMCLTKSDIPSQIIYYVAMDGVSEGQEKTTTILSHKSRNIIC